MATGSGVLSMYRAFLREAARMPTRNRRVYVERKVRSELEANRKVADPDELQSAISLMEFQLDTVRLQAGHLNELARTGNLKGPKD